MKLGEKKPPELGLNGWMNIMKKGDRVENHNHGFRSNSYLSGNFIVSCNNTKTVYNNPFQQYVKENKLLRMVDEVSHLENKVDVNSLSLNNYPAL